jgi:hypothetical protein
MMARITIAKVTANGEEWAKLTDELKEKFISELADAVDSADGETELYDTSLDLEVIEQ